MPRRLGYHLVALRERAGLTQQQAADACGISRSYLSLLEHGRRLAPEQLRLRIVAAYHLDADEARDLGIWIADVRGNLAPLRRFLACNPEVAHLIGMLGEQRTTEQERGALGACIARILITRRRRARAREHAQEQLPTCPR